MTNQKVQLIINKYENREKEIEIVILQSSLVSLILLLMYISKVFEKVTKTYFLVISLSFIDNLGFIDSGSLVKEVEKALQKVA